MHTTKKHIISCIITIVSLFALTSQSAANASSTVKNLRGITIEILDAKKNTERNNKIVNQALNLAGTEYKYGGRSPETGFDCSGFVYYVYNKAAKIRLPRTAKKMSRTGKKVQKNALLAGDLLFFNTTGKPNSHVGIYIGNNQIIHAPRTGRSVSIESIKNTYWAKRYNGAKRID